MNEATARLGLPFILPGQAQKEIYHNEALVQLDSVVHAAVEASGLNEPPANPLNGQCWIVGPAPVAGWSGKAENIACFTEAGWRFVAPVPGMSAWDRSSGYRKEWPGTQWSSGEVRASSLLVNGKKVVGERLPAVSSPSGGTTIDAEARAAIAAIAATLKTHGLTD